MIQLAIAKRNFFVGPSANRRRSIIKGTAYPIISQSCNRIWIKTSNESSFGWVDAKDFTIVDSVGVEINNDR